MYKVSSLLSGLLLLAGLQHVQGQDLGNSPYSRYGLGDLNRTPGNIRTFGMGNVGVGAPNSVNAYVQNPALLYFVNRVSFETAVTAQTKSIDNGQTRKVAGDAGIGYLTLTVPVAKTWRSSVGLRPFSTVNYSTSKLAKVSGADVDVLTGNTGEGTITEAFFSNGVKLYKGLSVGLSGSYLFGTVNRSAYSRLLDSVGVSNPQNVTYSQQERYSDLMFKAGVSYRQPLGKKVNLTLGGTYNFETDLNQSRRNFIQRLSSDNSQIDEIELGTAVTGQAIVPAQVEAGFSFDNAKSWVVAGEFSARKWSRYQDLRTNAGTLGDSYRIGLGGELTPDPASIDSYLKRVAYRTGFSYAQTPFLAGQQPINDVSLHAGVSLPLGSVPRPPEYNQSYINLGVAVGRMGNTDNGALRESYLRLMVGLTLNSSWFIKPKFD